MRVAVLGARGQLGAALVHECRPHHEVVALDRATLDITDAAAVAERMGAIRPDAIVNATGYNAVDAAETHAVDALRVNAFGVRTLARAAGDRGAILVHYGSDFVFDGTATEPYTEADRPNPLSVYAASKMLGEWFAADAARAYVLRVESLFGRAPDGPPAKGSVAAIVHALARGDVAKAFADRTVSPTSVTDAARATRLLLEGGAPFGLYHCVNSGYGTWTELALEASRLLGVPPRIEAIRLDDVKLPAARPRYCALSNRKLAGAGIEMPSWRAALAEAIRHDRPPA
jgi:dTDP-4-dehydrorhamnose reductase